MSTGMIPCRLFMQLANKRGPSRLMIYGRGSSAPRRRWRLEPSSSSAARTGHVFSLLISRHETTRNAIRGGWSHYSSTYQGQLLVKSESSNRGARILRYRARGILRRTPPSIGTRRSVLSAGEKCAVVSSATVTSRVSDPHRFDITRRPSQHGVRRGGPHYCLGAAGKSE